MKRPNTHERFSLWIEFKKRLSTSSPRPRQIAVFWERIGCEVLMGPKDNNHGDISTPNPDSSVAPGRVWRQTAAGWVGGHHMHIKSHYIIERLKARSLLTSQGPDEAGAVQSRLWRSPSEGIKQPDVQSFFFFPFFSFLHASLVFLESRLNSTQDYNLVGRLGGREENHLATIAAAEEGRIWNSHREGKKKKKEEDGKKYEWTHPTAHRVSGLRREAHRNSISHNTGNVVVVVLPELYYLEKTESTNRRKRVTRVHFTAALDIQRRDLKERCNFACKSDS